MYARDYKDKAGAHFVKCAPAVVIQISNISLERNLNSFSTNLYHVSSVSEAQCDVLFT